MIITCPSCDKKFNLDSSLIPSEGRSLQCGRCSHKWYFILSKVKKEIKQKNKDLEIKKINLTEKVPVDVDKIITDAENISTSNDIPINKSYSRINLINIFFLSIITFIAIILILDTFKFKINSALPGFNLLLINFYESLKDMYLFFKDLII